MTTSRVLTFVCLAVFYFCQGGALYAAEQGGCITSQCHADLAGADIHPEEQDCRTCHPAVSARHPDESEKPPAAVNAVQCESCHPAIVDHSFLHPPVAAGDCFACHNPHGDPAGKLLRDANEQVLCQSCHKNAVNRTSRVLHGPVAQGRCTPCHAPHGALYGKLFDEKYSSALFIDYNDDEYQLCFSCHKRDLLLFPDTSFYTAFRNGEKNLHYLHVNKASRGRSCKLCHVNHAGMLPKLIKDKVAFGNWRFSMNFHKTDTGGSCSPGCHEKAGYDRKIPVSNFAGD